MLRKVAAYIIGSVILSVLLSMALLPVSNANNHNKTGLKLSPLSYDVTADPGESFQKEVRVTNTSDKKIAISPTVDDFVAGGESGEPKILIGGEKGSERWSIKKWVETGNKKINLKPKEEKLLYYTVKIPKDAEPGGHYGVVRFTASSPNISTDAGVAIAGSVGQLLLVKVNGDIVNTGRIKSFYTKITLNDKQQKTTFFEQGPVDFEIRFENTGNVHYKPLGTIDIQPLFGKKIKLSTSARNVLPNSIRRYETQWKNAPSYGYFKATAEMKNESMKAISSTVTFFIIPWKIVSIILFSMMLVGFLFVRQIRLSKKIKILNQNKK